MFRLWEDKNFIYLTNTTAGLAILTSISYFYAGLSKKGFLNIIIKYFIRSNFYYIKVRLKLDKNILLKINYFKKYIQPTPILLPINVLEDFTKPLSLSFRLFGNILADELVVAVLVSLVPLIIPVPLIFLGLFTSGIQALIFATLSGSLCLNNISNFSTI